MSIPARIRILALGLATLAVAACGAGGAPDAQPRKDDRPRHYIGKPRAPVDARILAAPALYAGVPVRLILEVRPGADVDGIAVELAGDEGLSLVSSARQSLPATRAHEPRELAIDLTPTSGGARRLTAVVTLLMGQQRQVRPVSLDLDVDGPVTVQAAQAKPARTPQRDASGRLVDSMLAETTTR